MRRGAPRKTPLVLLSLALTLGCQKQIDLGTLPRIEIPIEADPPPSSELADREEEPAPPEEEKSHDLPDPPAARHADQVELLLEFRGGAVTVTRVRHLSLKEPRTTPRQVGRFAVELWRGAELIERLRFDFPLLGAEEKDGHFESGLETQAKVMIPALERPTRLRVLDRLRRAEQNYRWPILSDGVVPADAEESAESVGEPRGEISPSADPAPASPVRASSASASPSSTSVSASPSPTSSPPASPGLAQEGGD